MNKVHLLGRIAKDIELKGEEKKYCLFTLAVSRKVPKDYNGQTADFINMVAFGKTAESITRYFFKGQRILVSGKLQSNVWLDKKGVKQFSLNVVVEEFSFIESKASSLVNSDTSDDEDLFSESIMEDESIY